MSNIDADLHASRDVVKHHATGHQRPVSTVAVVTGAGYKELRLKRNRAVHDFYPSHGCDAIHNAEDGITGITQSIRTAFLDVLDNVTGTDLERIDVSAQRACDPIPAVHGVDSTVIAAVASRIADRPEFRRTDPSLFAWLGDGVWDRAIGGLNPIPVTVLVSACAAAGVDIADLIDGLYDLDDTEPRRNRPPLRHISDRTLLVLLGDRLAQLRHAVGLTQADVSRLIGRAQGSIAQWESGATEPSVTNLVAYAEALGVNPSAFFFGLPHGSFRDHRISENRTRALMLNDLACFNHHHDEPEYIVDEDVNYYGRGAATGGFTEHELHALLDEIGVQGRGLYHRAASFDALGFVEASHTRQ